MMHDRCCWRESFKDLKVRFLPFMAHLIAEENHDQGNVLLVSHGGILHQMLPLALTNVDRTFTKLHPLGNCEFVVARLHHKNLDVRSGLG